MNVLKELLERSKYGEASPQPSPKERELLTKYCQGSMAVLIERMDPLVFEKLCKALEKYSAVDDIVKGNGKVELGVGGLELGKHAEPGAVDISSVYEAWSKGVGSDFDMWRKKMNERMAGKLGMVMSDMQTNGANATEGE